MLFYDSYSESDSLDWVADEHRFALEAPCAARSQAVDCELSSPNGDLHVQEELCLPSSSATKLLQLPKGVNVLLVNSRGMLDAFEVTPASEQCYPEGCSSSAQRRSLSCPALYSRTRERLEDGRSICKKEDEDCSGKERSCAKSFHIKEAIQHEAEDADSEEPDAEDAVRTYSAPCAPLKPAQSSRRSRARACKEKSKRIARASELQCLKLSPPTLPTRIQHFQCPQEVLQMATLHKKSSRWPNTIWSFRSIDMILVLLPILVALISSKSWYAAL